MTPEEFEHVDDLFHRAAALPEAERGAFLDEACAGASEVRANVEALLAHDASPHDVLRVDLTQLGEAAAEAAHDAAAAASGPLPERLACYRVLDVLGVGGMGVVYRAEQENPRRVVALKLVRPGAFSPNVLKRFEQEGHVLGRLQHPGIAQIFEAGTTGDGTAHGRQPYFAMELVDGRPLLEFAEAGKLGTRERVELLARICDALEHAHGKGVVHRDLKPGNILVQEAGPDDVGQPKVLDFGVARVLGSDLATTTLRTDVGQLVGTLPYMSPEQIAGDPAAIDTRCDVYALGVILFELLTGRLPHDVVDKPLPEAARLIRDHDPLRPSALDRTLRGDLDTIVAKALAKEPPRRYASAAALAADLRRYLADEPIVARPPTTLYQLRKFARRNKAVVIGVAAVMFVLAAGMVVSTALYVRSEHRAEVLRQTSYAQRIALARHAYETDDGVTMARLLRECPEDLRHWEWDRLAYLADRSVRTFRGHAAAVSAVAFTPDGKRLVTTGAYDAVTLDENRDATVRVWDVETGASLMVLRGHTSPIHGLAVSADGARLATGCWAHWSLGSEIDRRILVWDAATGAVLHAIEMPHGSARRLAFFDRGRRLFAGSTRMFSIETRGGEVLAEHGRHDIGVEGVVVAPDGTTVVSAGYEGTLRVADLQTGREVRTSTTEDGPAMLAVAISPDGTTIATGGTDEIVRLQDLDTGAPRGTLHGHTDNVTALAFGVNGHRLVSGSADGTLRVWDLARGETERVLHGHARPVTDLAVGPDGRWIASASDDGTAKLWRLDAEDDRLVRPAAEREVRAVAWDPAGARLATTGDGGSARVFDASTGAELRRLHDEQAPAYTLGWSPDGARLVTGGWEGQARIWDVASGAVIAGWPAHGRTVRKVAFSPNGTRVVSVAWADAAKLWDASTGELVRELPGLEGHSWSVAWSADGARVIAAGGNGEVLVWRPDTGRVLDRLRVTRALLEPLAVRADARRFAVGDLNGFVHVWDLDRRVAVLEIEAHARSCRALAFSPDGRRLLTGGFDEKMHLFDAESGQLLMTFELPRGVNDVAFSPQGDRIAAGSADKLFVWKTRDDAGRDAAAHALGTTVTRRIVPVNGTSPP